MPIRKRTWRNSDGSEKTVFVADVTDANGHRERRQFASRKEADAFRFSTGSKRAGTFRGDA
jgi:integrase